MKALSCVFGIFAAIISGCILVLFLADNGARVLGEDFNLTPWWMYAVLGCGALALAILAWFTNWYAEQPKLRVLPPNTPEPEEGIYELTPLQIHQMERLLKN